MTCSTCNKTHDGHHDHLCRECWVVSAAAYLRSHGDESAELELRLSVAYDMAADDQPTTKPGKAN